MSQWVPVFCPDCEYEDSADADMLDRGYFLRCARCDCRMVTADELNEMNEDTGEEAEG